MSPFLRKVPTGSGATAVQIVSKRGGQRKILEHLGSAHTESELALLMQIGREKLNAEQGTLDLGLEEEPSAQAVVRSTRSGILINAIRASYAALGFDEAVNDEAFFQMVLARLVEPTSKADGVREIGRASCRERVESAEGAGAWQREHIKAEEEQTGGVGMGEVTDR